MTIQVKVPYSTFHHIPKTGGVSVGQWLKDNMGGEEVLIGKHKTPVQLKKKYGKNLGYEFCVVRNPWERLVSMYHYSLQKDSFMLANVDSFEDWILYTDWGACKRPQMEWAKHCDYVLRFENLNEDFKVIQDFYHCHAPLPHKNASSHGDYRGYYTSQEMIDLVAYKHEIDIKKFGYEF
jgi:hypothetical protein